MLLDGLIYLAAITRSATQRSLAGTPMEPRRGCPGQARRGRPRTADRRSPHPRQAGRARRRGRGARRVPERGPVRGCRCKRGPTPPAIARRKDPAEVCAPATEARCAHVGPALSIGRVRREAAARGTIGLAEDGDRVALDIPCARSGRGGRREPCRPARGSGTPRREEATRPDRTRLGAAPCA